jgi:lipopolysaccharide/colanic/teichoic acid biosynthesis glycosyltransferase
VTQWLFPLSLLLTVAVAGSLRRARRWPVPARAYRTAVVASSGLMALVWCALYVGHRASLPGPLLTTGGAFVGGVVTTTRAIGFVEENAPPSPEVREKVLAHHNFGNLRYPPQPRFKRTLDVALASLGLIVTLPLWFVIAVVIWFEDPGPIFFTKNSVGLAGVPFRQLKFRSMRYDAERTTGPIASYPDDPRTLRCGRQLRRWHLDQLPELVNVLAGTMSMVGPRPLRTVLVQGYLEELPEFAERHTVRPGIAGIAQIEKYQMPPAERLRKDRAYIRRMSVGLDLRLLARAVMTTVRGTRHEA